MWREYECTIASAGEKEDELESRCPVVSPKFGTSFQSHRPNPPIAGHAANSSIEDKAVD